MLYVATNEGNETHNILFKINLYSLGMYADFVVLVVSKSFIISFITVFTGGSLGLGF